MSIQSGDAPSLGQGSGIPNGDRRPNTQDSLAPDAASQQKLWTCVPCRKKKIKCDKQSPCSNCTKSHTECVASASGRASRKPRTQLDSELLESRLARLEAVASQVKHRDSDGNVPSFTKESDEVELFRQWRNVCKSRDVPSTVGHNSATPSSTLVPLSSDSRSHDSSRLLLNKQGTNHFHSCCWGGLTPQATSTCDKDNVTSPSQVRPGLFNFIFQPAVSAFDLGALHPPPESIPCMWFLFQRNVEPLVKVFHAPSMSCEVLGAADRLFDLPREREALMFAIYHGVVCSLDEQECAQLFGESQIVLAGRYRFALEQALANADFLDSVELSIARALIIFLTVLRTTDKPRALWTMTGLLTRIAQKIGLHRDGSHFGLTPFEIEMRRRLWWQVCVMDARASEDHGCSATIVEAQFDTQMPLNVNDDDLVPDMTELPPSRRGITDMTICLVSFELANTFRRMSSGNNFASSASPSYAALTTDQKDEWVSDCRQRMSDTYLTHDVDMSVPKSWTAATLTQLLLSKVRLMAHHPLPEADNGDTRLPEDLKAELLKASIEAIECSNLLGSDRRGHDLAWYFRTYFQWHSVVFALSTLCSETQGRLVDRAWAAVEVMVRLQGALISNDPRYAHLYQPVRRLLLKARMAREKVLMSRSSVSSSGPGNGYPIACYPAIDALLRHGKDAGATTRTLRPEHSRGCF